MNRDIATGAIEWMGGFLAAWVDPAEDVVVWWGAEHPRGGTPYSASQPISAYLAHGPSGLESPSDVPLDVRRGLDQTIQEVRAAPPPGEPPQQLATYACRGDVEAVRRLLDRGASADGRTPSGATALGCALARREEEIAALLVSRGADPALATSRPSERPLAPWLEAKLWGAARALLDRGFAPTPRDLETALLFAPVALVRAIADVVPIAQGLSALAAHHRLHDRLEKEPDFAAFVRERNGSLPVRPRVWSGRVPRGSLRAAAREAEERRRRNR